MKVTNVSIVSGKTHTMEIQVEEDRLKDYLKRKAEGTEGLIQDEFPDLSEDEREFILSGITSEE